MPSETPLLSIHRLQLGLPGYLILFAPLAFAPQRQLHPSVSLSPPAFLQISTHFTAPPGVPHAPDALKPRSFETNSPVKLGDFNSDIRGRLRAL